MLSNIDAEMMSDGTPAIKSEKSSEREAVQLMLIGSAPGIDGIVKSLHLLGFAEAGDWSKSQNYPNSDRTMKILTKWKA
jgi:hypothetical protein